MIKINRSQSSTIPSTTTYEDYMPTENIDPSTGYSDDTSSPPEPQSNMDDTEKITTTDKKSRKNISKKTTDKTNSLPRIFKTKRKNNLKSAKVYFQPADHETYLEYMEFARASQPAREDRGPFLDAEISALVHQDICNILRKDPPFLRWKEMRREKAIN